VDRAHAHESDYSYLRLDVDARQVRGELEIHARDALFLLGADPALAEADAWRALRSLEPQLRERLARGVEIRSASQPCPLSLTSGLRADPGGRDYALLRLEAECAAAVETLEVRYPLIFELDIEHRGFFAIRDARQTHVGVFTASEPSLRVAIAQADRWQQFADYAREGVAHIAAGFDHLLFLITLLLPVVLTRSNGRWQPRARAGAVMRRAVAIATAFTLAHSITLALAVFELVRLPARLVESSIAFSVLVAAWNNLRPLLREHGWWLAFGFGLVHGLGFAGALAQLGLPPHAKGLALFAFNVGVEAGQLAIVAAIVPLLYALRARAWYERAVLGVGSWLIAWIAAIWLLERALAVELITWL
ncbi:MAG TPA: HupE/UreJ family protein, partial [Myxococcota bacterium]|nr:HupE/UreJ family protein [Myxococcota bacterium]